MPITSGRKNKSQPLVTWFPSKFFVLILASALCLLIAAQRTSAEVRFKTIVPVIVTEDILLHRFVVSFIALANDFGGVAVTTPSSPNFFVITEMNAIRAGRIESTKLRRVFSQKSFDFLRSVEAGSETCQIVVINPEDGSIREVVAIIDEFDSTSDGRYRCILDAVISAYDLPVSIYDYDDRPSDLAAIDLLYLIAERH